MRIHTYLIEKEIRLALLTAKRKGHVAEDVRFDPLTRYTSRSREHAWEAQLGVSSGSLKGKEYPNQHGKQQKTRRVRQVPGEVYRFAATWHEWGWFLAELYDMDNTAVCGRIYKSQDDFDRQTKWQFEITEASPKTWTPNHP